MPDSILETVYMTAPTIMPWIHIVKIKVDNDFDYTQYLHWFLPDIVQKIESFRFRHDRVVAFISALLKYYYLAKILNIPQERIVIKDDEFNRPYLALPSIDSVSPHVIDFNVSHSGNYVVMAVSVDVYVGIDIEHRPITDIASLGGMAKIVFSESELALFNNDADNFLLLWTKKEALLKVIGTGFADELHKVTSLDLSIEQELVLGGDVYISVSWSSDPFGDNDEMYYILSIVVKNLN
jgi:phosphopantetheinyl transferase